MRALALVTATAALVGCGKSEPPPFRLNMTNVVAKQIAPEHQQAIANILGAMFGSPDEPVALKETGLDQIKLDMAAGPVWSDKVGTKHGLYRRHCVHCHGISGDGRGPTAVILNPYPRDYRPGIFKFKSTYTSAEPTTADLMKTLHEGIPGTAMPSFALLPPDEVAALVEYVKYLSMRGQMETALESHVADELNPGDKFDPANDPAIQKLVMQDLLGPIVEAWGRAKDQVIAPEDASIPQDNRSPQELAASVRAGRDLFYGTRANCVKCHGPTALGDGQQDDYDNWNKATNEFIKATDDKIAQIDSLKADLAKAQGDDATQIRQQIQDAQKEFTERHALVSRLLSPRNAIPRNLREGVFRGGRRPIDVFWRVSSGIPGTPMPASGPAAEGAQGTLTQKEIWQIVDYVHSLPFEPASLPQKRPINSSEVSTGE
ncbi:MAG TPA: cytochrome c [Lacipirellulaceae bacterium]|jgi:mono/diheme cytochrome c family protein|nr:cytochrome c [Lacipirellulaceae bacterium]